jgi:hypothetical protein
MGYDVRRILEPTGRSIERTEIDGHYDEGRCPGLRHVRPLEMAELTIPTLP